MKEENNKIEQSDISDEALLGELYARRHKLKETLIALQEEKYRASEPVVNLGPVQVINALIRLIAPTIALVPLYVVLILPDWPPLTRLIGVVASTVLLLIVFAIEGWRRRRAFGRQVATQKAKEITEYYLKEADALIAKFASNKKTD